ncbi:MAG: hypothetical protein ACI3XW_04595, partial [Butyricicoccus sp.]
LLPPRLPQFGLHSVVYSYNDITPLSMAGINQYATPNGDRADRDFCTVPRLKQIKSAIYGHRPKEGGFSPEMFHVHLSR